MKIWLRHCYLWLLIICIGTPLMVQGGELALVTTDAQGNAYLLDTDGMTRKGYLVYVWQSQNLIQADSLGAQSIRSQVEFDCRFRRARTMWVMRYADVDEGGATLSSDMVPDPQWVSVQPGDVTDTLIDYACRRIMR
jgi:hypothetical protein